MPEEASENVSTLEVAPQAVKKGLMAWLMHPNAPYIACAVIIAVAGIFFLKAKAPNLLRFNTVDIVVFDPVKFLNAQRQAAAILVTNPTAELSLMMTQVAKQAEAVIKEEAGGSVVLVKQAVVGSDDYTDITDRVLERFGLSTNVPTVTVTTGESLADIAPSDAAFSREQLAEDYRMELLNRANKLQQSSEKAGQQLDVVP